MTDRSHSLIQTLIRMGPASGKVLAHALGISQPTFSRAVMAAGDRLEAIGSGRSTLYAAKRRIRGLESRIPLFGVSPSGRCERQGFLSPIYPRGFVWIDRPRSAPPMIYPGIPFFLSDSRPQGFLGRSFSERHAALRLPRRLTDWNEDDFMEAIARRGEDCVGNLIAGRESFERFQCEALQPPAPLSPESRAAHYVSAASSALEGAAPGSSAAGEQPKFTALLQRESGLIEHVIVKFSPQMDDFQGRRWADLLICESIALDVLAEAGIPVARAEILEAGGRTFLEVTRFDRVGALGRIGMISLAAVDDEWFGERDHWIGASIRLEEKGAISRDCAERLRVLDSFGGLIANTDRHFGNISFFWEIGTEQLRLAPVYDMLPMLYVPVENRPTEREFRLTSPKPEALEEWNRAIELARSFWARVASDPRISHEFKVIAGRNRADLSVSAAQ